MKKTDFLEQMKEAVFFGAVIGVLALVIFSSVAIKDANTQRERNERTFRAECEALNGRAVFNNKHWECLK